VPGTQRRAWNSESKKLFSIGGTRPAVEFHRTLARSCGTTSGWAATRRDSTKLSRQLRASEGVLERTESRRHRRRLKLRTGAGGQDCRLPRVERMLARDALHREESCGGHFREEHQTEERGSQRDDHQFCYVAAWEYTGDERTPKLHKEPLEFEYVKPSQRSYK